MGFGRAQRAGEGSGGLGRVGSHWLGLEKGVGDVGWFLSQIKEQQGKVTAKWTG